MMTDEFVVQAANEAFGCFAAAVLGFSGLVSAAAILAIVAQFVWYGGW